MEERNQVLIDRPLTRFEEFIFRKNRYMLKPELVPGSSQGTMLENDPDVEIVRRNPTRLNWCLFLTKKDFRDDGDRLINIDNNDWPIRYALARTFSGKNVAYDLKVTADMFCQESFLCFPEAMNHIIRHGKLDCTISWSQTDYLDVRATLDYREHYPDRNVDGLSVFYWYGQLDRNGILRGKLKLCKDYKETY
mgnify:FL=1|nr:hypothetical protein [uncultured Duncaniella sp.]